MSQTVDQKALRKLRSLATHIKSSKFAIPDCPESPDSEAEQHAARIERLLLSASNDLSAEPDQPLAAGNAAVLESGDIMPESGQNTVLDVDPEALASVSSWDWLQADGSQIPTYDRGIYQYAMQHGLEPRDVQLDTIRSSQEGIAFWCCLGLDLSRRGRVGQCFGRALAKVSGPKTIYNALDDCMKKEFRSMWALERNFQFTEESRTRTWTEIQQQRKKGFFLNFMSLANKLGGFAFEEARKQAECYVAMCKRDELVKDFVVYNEWTQSENYLYIERLLEETNIETWTVESKAMNSVNLWQEKAMICKARRHYADHLGRSLESVSKEEVEKSSLGLEGWAEATLALSVASPSGSNAINVPKPKARSKPKASPKPKPQTKSNDETEAKAILVQFDRCEFEMQKIQNMVIANPVKWDWAKGYIRNYNDKATAYKSDTQDSEDFMSQFKASALSAQSMRQFKKDTAQQFDSTLQNFVTKTKPLIMDMACTVGKIQSMAAAENSDMETASKASSKRRRG